MSLCYLFYLFKPIIALSYLVKVVGSMAVRRFSTIQRTLHVVNQLKTKQKIIKIKESCIQSALRSISVVLTVTDLLMQDYPNVHVKALMKKC